MTASCQLLADDLPLSPGVPGGSESYRQTLTTSFFFKFYLTVLQQLEANKVSKCVGNVFVVIIVVNTLFCLRKVNLIERTFYKQPITLSCLVKYFRWRLQITVNL